MNKNEITGIIDIGSNTVRLAVYQLSEEGAYRVIDQGKWTARLSQRMTSGSMLPDEVVAELSEVLRHFATICEMHGTSRIRAVATAAIRQAVNGADVIRQLKDDTGIAVEILSGEDEARIGSHATLSTMNVTDGFIVDIGGGSTEVSLFRNRRIVKAVSFPVGCVNMAARFALGESPVQPSVISDMQLAVRQLLGKHRWIAGHPGLPLIGLGGTVRALAKLRQRESEYPLSLLHGYELEQADLAETLGKLAELPLDKRKKLPGLSKDRGDVIVPGLAILLGIVQQTASARLVVSGAGLRDGLFLETCLPQFRAVTGDDVLEESIRNLSALYPTAPEGHLNQVRKLALILFDSLSAAHGLPSFSRRLLETAARLFKIGAVIDFNDSADHTFYMLLHTHWNGLSHREIVITAAVAAYTSIGQLRRKLTPYRSLLADGDIELACKLGSMLQLAAALDRSESQAIASVDLFISGSKLHLIAYAGRLLPVEQMEVESIAKEFKKNWGLAPILSVSAPEGR